ncbi:MAG: type II toxin-antitoxin system HicA family toxin [bacterium]|nr:type II toxin-antitoxin system HicA family toxin [bacterium]
MPSIKPVSYKTLCKIFEKEDWKFSHQTGDHLIYKKSGAIRPLVIPMYREIPTFVILNNLRTAGIPRDKYFELLEKV